MWYPTEVFIHPSIPFLPCCSFVAWQLESNIGLLFPNFPSSPTKDFLHNTVFLLLLLLRLPRSLFLFLLPLCQFPVEGTSGISDEEMENIPQTAQAAAVKGDFHNESLDDLEKDSAWRFCAHLWSLQRSKKCPLFFHSATCSDSFPPNKHTSLSSGRIKLFGVACKRHLLFLQQANLYPPNLVSR